MTSRDSNNAATDQAVIQAYLRHEQPGVSVISNDRYREYGTSVQYAVACWEASPNDRKVVFTHIVEDFNLGHDEEFVVMRPTSVRLSIDSSRVTIMHGLASENDAFLFASDYGRVFRTSQLADRAYIVEYCEPESAQMAISAGPVRRDRKSVV